jgi:hypothetical protein
MNAYRRPGYPGVPASESHLLQVVGTCHPLAAQVLAFEDRHGDAVMRSEQIRRLHEAGLTSGTKVVAPTRFRQSVGSALVRIGERLAGTPTAATIGSAS